MLHRRRCRICHCDYLATYYFLIPVAPIEFPLSRSQPQYRSAFNNSSESVTVIKFRIESRIIYGGCGCGSRGKMKCDSLALSPPTQKMFRQSRIGCVDHQIDSCMASRPRRLLK